MKCKCSNSYSAVWDNRIRRYMTVVSIFLIGLNRQHLSALEGKNFRQLNYKGRPYISGCQFDNSRIASILWVWRAKWQTYVIWGQSYLFLPVQTSKFTELRPFWKSLRANWHHLEYIHTTIIDAKLFTVRHVLCIHLTCSWHQKNRNHQYTNSRI